MGRHMPLRPAQSRKLRGPYALGISDDQLSAPSELAYHAPSNLAERGDSASLIYITHPDFLIALNP
jgi:hypothetical protein